MTSVISQALAVAAGGALGSALRFLTSLWVHGLLGRGFPYGTLAVNVLGCLLMGLLFELFLERFASGGVLRAAVLIGFLGGYTTFSAFSIETLNLVEQGALAKAAINVAGSIILCIGATWIGIILGRQV